MNQPEATDQYKMQVIKFIIKVMLTINQELIEHGEVKSVYAQDLNNRVKDGIRQFAIQDIIQTLAGIVL